MHPLTPFAAQTIDGSTTTATFTLPANKLSLICAYIECGNITGLTYTFAATTDSVSVTPWAVNSTGVPIAAGGTVTGADGLKTYFLLPYGTTSVTVTRTAGSGPVRLILQDRTDEMNVAIAQAIGAGGQYPRLVTISPSVVAADANIGDVLFDSEVLDAFTASISQPAKISSVQMQDKSDQAIAINIVVFKANRSLGTEDSAPSISDANAEDILGIIPIEVADYIDIGGSKIARVTEGDGRLPLYVEPVSADDSVYVAGYAVTEPSTYAATDLFIRFAVTR